MLTSKSPRIFELDVLRGVACLLVVLGHFILDIIPSGNWLWSIGGLGGKGVWLFFLISGFVIFMTVEQTHKPLDFCVSRFSRLFPTYWVAVIFSFLVIHLFHLEKENIGFLSSLLNLTMIQSFLGVDNLDKVYWTLKVELLFYGWMFILLVSRNLKAIDSFLMAFLTISLLFILFIPQTNNVFSLRILNEIFILDYIHWFALGIIFYKMYKKKELGMSSMIVIALSLFVMGLRSFSTENCLLNLSIVLIFIIVIFCKMSFIKPIAYIGSISYALYLIHSNLGHVLLAKLTYFGINPVIAILIVVTSLVFLADMITKYIEVPLRMRIKDKYYQSYLPI